MEDDDEDLGRIKIHMDDNVNLDNVFDLDEKPATTASHSVDYSYG